MELQFKVGQRVILRPVEIVQVDADDRVYPYRVKGLEGVGDVWVEAQDVSRLSEPQDEPWHSLPIGTKVLVRDYDYDDWVEGEFVYYNPDDYRNFTVRRAYESGGFYTEAFSFCKLP